MKKIFLFIKDKIKNRPKKPKWEIIYDSTSILIILFVSGYLIFKEVTTENAIKGLLNKSKIAYSDVSCGGFFSTDCEIDNVSILNGAVNSKKVYWSNVLGISKENGTSNTNIKAYDINITEPFSKVLSTYGIFKIIGPEELKKGFDGSSIEFESNFDWNNSKLTAMNDLKIKLDSKLTDLSIETSMKDMDKDTVISDTNVKFDIDKVVKTIYNRYQNDIRSSKNSQAINIMYFNKDTNNTLQYGNFKKELFNMINEASISESAFYENTDGFYKEYYKTIKELSLKDVHFVELTVRNTKNTPASVLQSGYINPYDTNILDVKMKTY